jgi:ariadne-1
MFSGWLESKVKEAAINPICFAASGDSQCNTTIDEEDIRSNLSTELLEKYERFKNQEEQPNLRNCPKCAHEQVGDPKNPVMTCEKCENVFCFEHAGAHPDQTCTEYELAHRKENKLNAAYLAVRTKPCPKCSAATQKNHGCNHMSCIKVTRLD